MKAQAESHAVTWATTQELTSESNGSQLQVSE